ncbi:MAG: hypothetical protein JKY57_04000 [Kordiimonadaceae bacterium]|nr:hypothetical protein [Kordiimonadaceae bacterium]
MALSIRRSYWVPQVAKYISARILAGVLIAGIGHGYSASSEAAQVSFTKDKYGRVYLPVSTSPPSDHMLLFDSGAGRSAIVSSDIVLMQAKVSRVSSLRHLTSSGFKRVPYAWIGHFFVAGIDVENHMVGLYPYRQGFDEPIVRGLIGFDAFRGRLLHIRQKAETVEIYANSGVLDRTEWGLLTGHPNANASIVSDFKLGELEVSVLIASGYSRSVVNMAAYDIFLAADMGCKGEVVKVSRGMRPYPDTHSSLHIKNLTINGWEIGDVTVARIDIDSRMLTGYMDAPLLILGADVLMAQDIVFDFRDFQLWYPLKKPEEKTNIVNVCG